MRFACRAVDGRGASGIVSVHISAKLSDIVNMARMAAEITTDVPVSVVDSGQLTVGTGLLALEAAKAAAGGQKSVQILGLGQSASPVSERRNEHLITVMASGFRTSTGRAPLR